MCLCKRSECLEKDFYGKFAAARRISPTGPITHILPGGAALRVPGVLPGDLRSSSIEDWSCGYWNDRNLCGGSNKCPPLVSHKMPGPQADELIYS